MSWRSLLARHFGEEAVLWTIEDGPEPTDQELSARSSARTFAAGVVSRDRRRREIEVVERALRGDVPGLTDDERAKLPELLAVLQHAEDAP